jgi:hypothetical protein
VVPQVIELRLAVQLQALAFDLTVAELNHGVPALDGLKK